MLPTFITQYTFAANETKRLLVNGLYFKILTSTGLLKVVSDFGTIDGISGGQGLEKTEFNYLTITNKTAAVNTVSILIGDENFIDGLTGTVVVSQSKNPVSGNFVNVSSTVTTASGQLLAANANRQYLLIQNKDTNGAIYVAFGAAATVANGVLIPAGGNFEMASCVSTQPVFAIGTVAVNSNIVTVEG